MTPPHPTLEQMAKLLAGKLEYDEMAFEVLPHLLAQGEVCAARVAEIRRLQGQVGREHRRQTPDRGGSLAAMMAGWA